MRSEIKDTYGHVHSLPGPFMDITEIKIKNRLGGGQWFSKDTIRFFSSKVSEEIIAGRIFISSEKDRGTYASWTGKRRYTIRVASDDGLIRELCEFGEYATLKSAKAAARRLVETEKGNENE